MSCWQHYLLTEFKLSYSGRLQPASDLSKQQWRGRGLATVTTSKKGQQVLTAPRPGSYSLQPTAQSPLSCPAPGPRSSRHIYHGISVLTVCIFIVIHSPNTFVLKQLSMSGRCQTLKLSVAYLARSRSRFSAVSL
jgi:hypothetical protein